MELENFTIIKSIDFFLITNLIEKSCGKKNVLLRETYTIYFKRLTGLFYFLNFLIFHILSYFLHILFIRVAQLYPSKNGKIVSKNWKKQHISFSSQAFVRQKCESKQSHVGGGGGGGKVEKWDKGGHGEGSWPAVYEPRWMRGWLPIDLAPPAGVYTGRYTLASLPMHEVYNIAQLLVLFLLMRTGARQRRPSPMQCSNFAAHNPLQPTTTVERRGRGLIRKHSKRPRRTRASQTKVPFLGEECWLKSRIHVVNLFFSLDK